MPIKTKKLPSAEYLHERFDLDPTTGILIWKPVPETDGHTKTWNTRFVGRVAGNANSWNHRAVRVDGKDYLAHRVIFKMIHGSDPPNELDHEDVDPSDNRIENLRPASRSENACNRKLRSDNSSGFKGVSFHKGLWRAQVMKDGKMVCRYFQTPEAADGFARQMREELHGEFARHE